MTPMQSCEQGVGKQPEKKHVDKKNLTEYFHKTKLL
jgi:hypothetical protein